MSINFQEAYKKIRPSIVGLGFRNDPEYLIIGAGFIVHQSGWIMTNKHVLDALLTSRDGKVGLHSSAAAFFFIKTKLEEGFVGASGMVVASVIDSASPPSKHSDTGGTKNKTFRGLKPRQIIPPEPLDIGVCKVDINNAPKELLPLIPATIMHSKEVLEGTPVGILGFSQGLSFPAKFDSRDSAQMTPLLQTGVISGVLPFSGLPKPDSFVLDLFVNSGSSGSPLFLSNGNVVGVVYATRQSFESLKTIRDDGELESSKNTEVFLPTSLGLAVPSARFPEDWLSKKA
jgi:S1-C subfamily serine protease